MSAKPKTTSRSKATRSRSNEHSPSGRSKQKLTEDSLRDYQAILATAEEVAKIGSWKWDLRTQKVTWSDEMFRLFGVEREGFDGDVNRVISNRIHPDDVAAVAESNRSVMEDSYPVPLSYRIVLPDGTERTVWAQGKLIRDEQGEIIALTGYVQDITERVRAEKKIIQLQRLYATLSQVNQMIVRVKEKDELFRTICQVCVEFGKFPLAWIGLLDETTGDVKPVAAMGIALEDWPFPMVNLHTGPLKNGLISQSIRTSTVMTTEDVQSNTLTPVLHDSFRQRGWHSSAVVPFNLRGKTIGALILVSQDKGLFKDEQEVSLLNEMGLDISFALDHIQSDRERSLVEELFSKAFHSSPVAIILSRVADGVFMDVNDTACQIYGFGREELLGHTSLELGIIHPEDRHKLVNALQAQGMLRDMEVTIHSRSRGARVVLYSMELLDIDGVQCMLTAMIDITERKNAEQALQESQQRLSFALERSRTGGWDLDLVNHTAYRSLEHDRIFGYESLLPEWTYEMFLDHVIPEDRAEVDRRFKEATATQTDWSFECRIRRTDGQIRWIWATGGHQQDSSGLTRRMSGIVQDITERKQSEEALRRSEQVLRLFVEHSPASIAMFDRDMKYIVASQRYLIDYRLELQDLTGRSHYEVFPEMPEHWKEIHRRCLNGAIEKADEDPFPRLDGALDWVRWEIRPWYEEGGNIGGIILFSEVITERKKIQDELRLLNLELEQRVMERTMELSHANRAKDEFLANMSHELRTPLNTVLGLSETLLEQRRGPLNEKQVQSLELIAASGQHLLGLINDILEVSKIEAGKLQLHPVRVSVKEVCESSLNFIKELALKKLIAVEFHNEEPISNLYADPQRLKQILINLLTNAVKFTPERGLVSLHVSTNAEKDQILFSVTDTGIGIALDDLKKLFTPFTQLDSSLSRQYPGTGLGLALVEKLTDLHGGSVRVESEVSKGSCFTVVLPLTQNAEDDNATDPVKVSEEPVISMTTPAQPGIVVLLAEDNKTNSEMTSEYLTTQGYSVVAAADGEEVLEKAMQAVPDVILMDIQMPKMDGLEATRRLRMDARFSSMPIIALTALTMPGDRERCFEAGVNEYLSKPVSLKMLVRVIKSLTEPGQ